MPLVSDRVPLVGWPPWNHTNEASIVRYEKTVQLLREMKTQGAKVIAVANAGDHNVAELVDGLCAGAAYEASNLLPIARGCAAATVCLFYGHRARRGCGSATESFQGGCGEVGRPSKIRESRLGAPDRSSAKTRVI